MGRLAVTYFRAGNPHYHRRRGVSPSCSGWEGVGPPRYGRQAKLETRSWRLVLPSPGSSQIGKKYVLGLDQQHKHWKIEPALRVVRLQAGGLSGFTLHAFMARGRYPLAGHACTPSRSTQGYRIKSHGQLVSVSLTCCHASTPDLSTRWSTATLQVTYITGRLILRQVSRLDAFSAYLFRT